MTRESRKHETPRALPLISLLGLGQTGSVLIENALQEGQDMSFHQQLSDLGCRRSSDRWISTDFIGTKKGPKGPF